MCHGKSCQKCEIVKMQICLQSKNFHITSSNSNYSNHYCSDDSVITRFLKANSTINFLYNVGKTPSSEAATRCSMKNGVLRNFTKFTGKHRCQGLFFNNFLIGVFL